MFLHSAAQLFNLVGQLASAVGLTCQGKKDPKSIRDLDARVSRPKFKSTRCFDGSEISSTVTFAGSLNFVSMLMAMVILTLCSDYHTFLEKCVGMNLADPLRQVLSHSKLFGCAFDAVSVPLGLASSASDMRANDLRHIVEGEIGDVTVAIAPETVGNVSNDASNYCEIYRQPTMLFLAPVDGLRGL